MSKIVISDLEVSYCIGITDEERARPQRLLITVDFTFDFTSSSVSDRIEKTINYADVAQELIHYGDNRNWKLLERLVANMADHIMAKYKPQSVTLEIKKFALPQTRYVSISLTRTRPR